MMTDVQSSNPPSATASRGLRDYRCLCRGAAVEHAHLDWVHAAERLSAPDCDEIVRACREFPLTPTTVVGEEYRPGHRQAEARKIGQVESTRWIFELLCGIAAEATQSHFSWRSRE